MATYRSVFTRKNDNGTESYSTRDFQNSDPAKAEAAAKRNARIAKNLNDNDPRVSTRVERVK